ncbi:DUF4386 domain-containing protein [Nonomuraea sp. PA05]|uniref:DUF4386 domain-containing protein n=1 Tax=Nonomuraea sp. PA05 TaxID=2604466 RepID=UPI0011DAB838|nr:DUF4386 domain-containing protein [Nonomuraea sp. PA05]TYB54319.1 DUF4386 domain-containing protein [Nonomuraea sp. PA05]
MDSRRRATVVAGVLIIAGMIAGVSSVVPVLEEPHFLGLVAAHESQIVIGAVAQFVMIPAYVGFALCLYPALKAQSEALSLGFLGFRMIAAGFHLVGVLLLPLFLVLESESAASVLRTARDLVNHVAVVVSLGLGDLLLFWILHRSRSVPRWLSAWGIAGIVPALVASFLVLFGRTGVVTPLYLAMTTPLAVQGLVLAGWLIVRGLPRHA